ncbi:MAG TPA: acetyl-CoA carboxylase biotin carboxyl carrier protein subunit [Stellaceae bacterium]|nr:acetyl-CoA carboxylase biotin carboxyl carrier protein subunit [Stellaceae bacterium]
MRFGGSRRSPLAPDPDLIRTLARLLAENGLTEIEYAVGDRLIRVSRGGASSPTGSPAPPAANASATPATSPSAPVVDPGAVTAPMVGTAYLAPQPGAPMFVQLGERVASGQPLLIIEAMKVMNEIRAPRAGRIAQILVEDAQPVEYGAVLMLIE